MTPMPGDKAHHGPYGDDIDDDDWVDCEDWWIEV